MPTLKVDSVQLDFGDRKILRDVALHCNTGEIVGLLGRNGSGKSTLLKVIFGTLRASHQYVCIDETIIKKGFISGQIAYLPQHNFLPRYAKVSKLASLMVANQFRDELFSLEIYRKHAHKRCEEVSGGELRQLEMLMLLYSHANFVLLDEPFTHVTPVQSDAFKLLLRRVAQTKGIIVTDHQYRNILEISDRLILMDNGITRQITDHSDLVHYHYLSGL